MKDRHVERRAVFFALDECQRENGVMDEQRMARMPDLLSELGLRTDWRWLRDGQFALALLAGVLFWVGLIALGIPTVGPTAFLTLASLIVLQPVLEELLFRGIVQGQLARFVWGRRAWGGISVANIVVTVVFVALHFLTHPPLWAFGVLLPSLLFGYFRDRHNSVYPAMALHVFYNAGYFLLPFIVG